MAQSDQTVQNATFPTVRSDLNDNLAALFSQSSGPSAPAVTVAYQPWIDTSSSPAVWKIRNGTNTGWVTVGTIDATTFAAGGLVPISSGGTGQTTASGAINALVPSQTGNANKFLQTDGSAVSWALAAAGASIQVFTASGTYTPSTSKTAFLVLATGGGGGYNSTSGWQGGAGGTAVRIYSVAEMGGSATVTMGAAGVGGNPATNGGNTVFDPGGTGLTITGIGGTGGGSTAGSGAGGGTTNSLLNLYGAVGGLENLSAPSFWGGSYGVGGGPYQGAEQGVVVVLEF